jgi:hypothetical protein
MKHPQINLTMAVLEHMMKSDKFRQEFPFITAAKRNWHINVIQKTNCGKCGKRPGRTTRVKTLEMVRASIIGLPRDRIARLKEMLNTDKIIMYFFNSGKQIRKEI